ncbi:MAG: sensor histidine kinase [Duganella sp.]
MLLVVMAMPATSHALQAFHDVADTGQLGVVLRYDLLEDQSARQTIAEVRNRADWRHVSGQSPRFGYTSSAWWLRLELGNSSAQEQDVVLDLKTPLQDYVDWYVFDADLGQLKTSVASGDRRPFDYRYQRNHTLSLPLTVRPGERLQVYLHMASHDGMLEATPLSLLSAQDFRAYRSQEKLYLGAYFGCVLAFCLCSLFLYVLTKENTYLLFSIFLFLTVCTNLAYYGVSAELLLPTYPEANNLMLMVCFSTAGGSFFLFARKFLRLAAHTPFVLICIYDAVICLLFAAVTWVFMAGYASSYAVIGCLMLLNTMLLLGLVIRMCLQKNVDALFFFIAFLPMGTLLSLKQLSLNNVFTAQYLLERNFYLAQTTIFAVVALGFSIAHSMKTLRVAMHDARSRELEAAIALKDSEAKMFHLARVTMAGEMTGAVAHELSQPLSSILTNSQAAEMMIKSHRLDHAAHLAIVLDTIHQAKMATAVIVRVRRLLFPGTQAVDTVYVPRVYATVQNLLRHDFTQKQISVIEQCEPGLYIRGDAIQLQQVMVNLLMNAVDAVKDLPPARRTITLSARRASERYALLSVADTGCGFPTNCQAEIFAAFFTTKEGGLGLGLNICKKIVNAHGGEITARPLVPLGSLVEFTMPLDDSR